MIYPADFETVTGFSQIREWLLAFCRYESSATMVSNLQFNSDINALNQLYNETDEWNNLHAMQPAALDLSGTEDISEWLKSLSIENYYFEEDALFTIKTNIETYNKIAGFLRKKAELFPLLNAICGNTENLEKTAEIIRSAIDPKGKLLPYASPEYGKINNEIEKLEKDARQLVRSIFRQWREAGYTAETDITVRDERLVIPVQSEHKRHVKGFVKDVSATGRVIYIEPMDSLELNNRLKELYAESRRERERILRLTTAKLRPFQASLEQTMHSLSRLDFIASRCSLAKKLNAQRPQLISKPFLELKNAVNPILWLKNKSAKKETVPMWLKLDEKERIVVISGPNAGGKSITLKTTLLLQYMAQCGLFITADPESTLGIFKNMAVDCGDGQSIDEGLSTFSAHLQHLKKMTSMAGAQSFFAVDELGDGTDPRFGGPIAQAVLEDFLQKGSYGIVTTHYSRLKEWAGHTPGILNASMAYNTHKLQPLYRLVTGKPGSSFALELLRKTGFDAETISRVESLSGEESQRTEELLLDLEEKQRELYDTLAENKIKQSQLDHLTQEYAALKEKIEGKKKEIIDAAKNKASGLIQEANKQIELTIRTIREHGANKEKTVKARSKLKAFEAEKINPKEVEKTPSHKNKNAPQTEVPPAVKEKINWVPGMLVRNKLNSGKGEILEVKKGKILVAFGLLKMWVTELEIEPIEGQKILQERKPVSGFNWVERQAGFSPTLDVRGLNADDALNKVRNWLDEAYSLGQNQLKIIHGRGDGILRKILREYFKTLNYRKSYKSEHEEQGGDGATLIELL